MPLGKPKQSRAVKHPPDEIPTFHGLLENSRPEDWDMSRRTYYRWLNGDLSEALDILIRNPALLTALSRDVGARRRKTPVSK